VSTKPSAVNDQHPILADKFEGDLQPTSATIDQGRARGKPTILKLFENSQANPVVPAQRVAEPENQRL
jgi:hypothetical protein